MKPCRGWNKTAWFQAGVWHNRARWNPGCGPWLHPTASAISLQELCIFCVSLWSQSHELDKGDTQTVATWRDSQCYTHRNGERNSNPAYFTPPPGQLLHKVRLIGWLAVLVSLSKASSPIPLSEMVFRQSHKHFVWRMMRLQGNTSFCFQWPDLFFERQPQCKFNTFGPTTGKNSKMVSMLFGPSRSVILNVASSRAL